MGKFTRQSQLTESEQKRQIWTHDKYFQYRYASGSYKHRKINVEPKLIEVKCGVERLALYGIPENGVKPIQIQALKAKLSYWKQLDKQRKRDYKAWLKLHHYKASQYAYEDWLKLIIPPDCSKIEN